MRVTNKGNFNSLEKLLSRSVNSKSKFRSILERGGQMGVQRLQEATPKSSGLTANSWDYIIKGDGSKLTLEFINSNINQGVPIAIIIQYGHATRNGFVNGIDYINPALKPVFDFIKTEIQKEVSVR